jgi:predicted O-methyltransferase YrrM
MASVTLPWLDPAIEQYAAAHSSPPDELQRRLIAETAERAGPAKRMQVSPDEGAFIEMVTRLNGTRRAVEVGTFTGYSALCVARALPADGRLLCCDVNEDWTSIAQRYWAEAGVADKIELRIGPAIDTLRALPDDEHLDQAFIDADKSGYPAYYEELLPRLRPGGLLMFDNTLLSGAVLEPDESDAHQVAMAKLNETLVADPRVDVVLLPIRDGLTLARKR